MRICKVFRCDIGDICEVILDKVRCLNEIEKEETKIIAAKQLAYVAETGNYGGKTISPAALAPKVKRKKTGGKPIMIMIKKKSADISRQLVMRQI